VFERPEVILVHEMGLLVARSRLRICSSNRSRWSTGSFSSEKALAISRPRTISSNRSDDPRPFVVAARERGDVDRVFRDEGRPNDLPLGTSS